MQQLKRFANTWTTLGALYGLWLGFLYLTYTTDPHRALLYSLAFVLLAVVVFNGLALVFAGAKRRGLSGVLELVFFQGLAAFALAVLSGYLAFSRPYTPAAEWTTLAPAPKRLVELVDVPYVDDSTWAVRAQSAQGEVLVYVERWNDGSGWLAEPAFMAEYPSGSPPDMARCRDIVGDGMYRPRLPSGAVDALDPCRCGADVIICHHVVLTADGTVWTSSTSSGWGEGLLMLLMSGVGVLGVAFVSAIIEMAR